VTTSLTVRGVQLGLHRVAGFGLLGLGLLPSLFAQFLWGT
jgi:hypothetical protein